MTKDIRIRQFRFPEDYDAVYTLWSQSGDGIHLRKSDEPQEIKKKVQKDPDLFILAENNGEIIGSVLCGFDGRRGMVYHLAVSQEFRRAGIGSKLMMELEQKLREKGCVRYYLLVTPDNNDAIRFYESKGWERMDLLAYGKDLDESGS